MPFKVASVRFCKHAVGNLKSTKDRGDGECETVLAWEKNPTRLQDVTGSLGTGPQHVFQSCLCKLVSNPSLKVEIQDHGERKITSSCHCTGNPQFCWPPSSASHFFMRLSAVKLNLVGRRSPECGSAKKSKTKPPKKVYSKNFFFTPITEILHLFQILHLTYLLNTPFFFKRIPFSEWPSRSQTTGKWSLPCKPERQSGETQWGDVYTHPRPKSDWECPSVVLLKKKKKHTVCWKNDWKQCTISRPSWTGWLYKHKGQIRIDHAKHAKYMPNTSDTDIHWHTLTYTDIHITKTKWSNQKLFISAFPWRRGGRQWGSIRCCSKPGTGELSKRQPPDQ